MPKPPTSSYQPVLNAFEVSNPQYKLREAGWWSRLLPFLVIIPTATSLTIGALHLRHYTTSGPLYRWSISNRALVQVFVHVLSSILSVFLVFSVCTVIGHWTRCQLVRSNVRLDTLRLWSAVTLARLNWNLPWAPALATLGFVALTWLPATLWAGALTPSLTHKLVHGIPLLVPGSGPHGNYSFLSPTGPVRAFGDCWTVQQRNGTFTNCPGTTYTGNLLRTVATASSSDGSPRNHSKWDNTKFQYLGRSYGVGAPPGLTDNHITSLDHAQLYSYTEAGFLVNATCIYNHSSALHVNLTHDIMNLTSDITYPNLYLASGKLPNHKQDDAYVQVALVGDEARIVSLFNHGADAADVRWMFGIWANTSYAQLHNIQCEFIFQPSNFLVDVSLANSTIVVSPDKDTPVHDPDPDPTFNLRNRASNYSLSFIVNSYYVSIVGDAFMENVRNMQIRQSLPLDTTAPNDTVLAAVADSVTAVVDDSLVALGSAALTFPNATNEVETVVSIAAVQIGSGSFILAVVVINVVGLLGVLCGMFLLREMNIPLFDYNDLGCLAFGVTNGSRDASRGVTLTAGQKAWDGDPRSSSFGRVTAKLEVSSEDGCPAVMLKS